MAAYLPARLGELAAEAARQAAWDAEPDLTPDAIADDTGGARERWATLCAPFEAPIREANRLREAADRPAEAAFRLPPPRTPAGLAVLARMLAGFHAQLWDGPADALEIDRRWLRTTLEAALAVAGVDRLGRPAAAPASASTEAGPSPDAALIPLAEAAIAAELEAKATAAAHADTGSPPGTYDRSFALVDRVAAADARTPGGLAAKARLLLTHAPCVDELEGDWRCQALALSIARDATRLGAAG